MNYEVYGPFFIDQDTSRPWTDRRAEFWGDVEDACEGLSRAIGIYVFSTCHGQTFTPWYVGKTAAKTGFRGEIFQDHKLSHYVSTTKRGPRCIHLIAKVTPNAYRFCKTSDRSKTEIDILETVMIGMGLHANRDLRNNKKTWFNRNCYVPGIIGQPDPGRPTDGARSLRSVFKLD